MEHLPHRSGPRRKSRVIKGGLAPVVAVAALFPTSVTLLTGTDVAAASGTGYVALGDSFASGPDIPTQLADPAGCLRSSNNYPHVAATALKLALTDVSCSGATTADMYAAQGVTPGPANPAQLSAITASTAAVSLLVGGDNVGFTSIH